MSICYGPTVFVIKLSILLQYLSIFVPVRKGNMFIFVGTWMIIGANFIYYTANTFIIAFLCTPRELIWNKNITEGKCIDLGIVLFVLGIYNAFSNLAILLLPIGPIWRLNLGWKQRLGVFAVFATGFLAVVASVARVIYTLRLKDHEDLTYNMVFLGFWTIAELGIGILCAALLVFPRFYQTMTYNVKHMMGVTPKTSVSEPSMKTGTSQEPWITGHQSDFERGGDYYWLDDRDPVPANKRRNHSSTRVRASRTDPFQGLSMAGAEGLGILKTVQIDVVRE